MKRYGGVLWVAVCLALASCGGGGSGGGSGAANNPKLSVDPKSITWSGDNTAAGGAAPTAKVTVTVNASAGTTVYIGATWTGDVIQNVGDAGSSGASAEDVQLTGWPAADLGAGTHSATLTLLACNDSACTQTIAGSAVTVAITYKVTGNVDPATHLSWPQTDYSFDLHATDSAPVVDIDARIDQSPPGGLYFNYSIGSGSLIESVNETKSPLGVDSDDEHFTLQLKAPSALALGQYSDSVTLNLCFDAACVHPVPNGTFTASVTYHMLVTQGVDYTVRTFAVTAADLKWNSSTGKLEVLAYGTSQTLPLALGELDPVSNTVGRSAHLHTNPRQLVVTDDGQYSYVLEQDNSYDWWLERVRSSDFTVDASWSFGGDISTQLTMQAVPGQPHALLLQTQTLAGYTLSIIDDGVARSAVLDQSNYVGAGFRRYFWSGTNSLLYAYQANASTLSGIAITASGVGPDSLLAQTTLVDTSRSNGFAVVYAGGLIFGVDGHVFDPAAGTQLTPFAVDPNPYKSELVVDPTAGRAYFLLDFSYSTIDSFAIAGRDNYWRIQLPGTVSNPYGMIRFGTDGLAFIAQSGGIVLLNSALIAH